MARNGNTAQFKRAIDRQNKLERARSGPTKRKRDAVEGEAAHAGLRALEKHSKGRPKQTATARKSPQTARSQAR
ncbi:MAG TPA: hypothetical protein VMW18_16335 [Candidatus Binatia bacterium]|nr:hypothetical protein [Candidatus Binatia bacterium]